MYVVWSTGYSGAMHEVQAKVAECSRGAGLDDPIAARIKQIDSVVAKLRRMPTKLSGLEDIAGCRIAVPTTGDVDRLLAQCVTLDVSRVRDYRESPNNSYRAVHLTVRAGDRKPVELQLRTHLQDLWANLAERCAALIDLQLKYGGGPSDLRDLLKLTSVYAATLDGERAGIRGRRARVDDFARSFGTLVDNAPDLLTKTAATLAAEEGQLSQKIEDFRGICDDFVRRLRDDR